MNDVTRLAAGLSAAALTLLVAACGEDKVAGQQAAAAPPAATVELGPLTGEDICDRLTAADVGAIIGAEVTAPKASSTTTPQCSYPYRISSGSSYNLTVAYQRVDGDLFGKTGVDGFNYVAQMQRANPDAKETEVKAGDKAVRFSGGLNLHYGLLLVGDRVMTAVAFTDAAKGEAIDELLKKMASSFDK